jgi:hypothetical protein
MKTANTLLVIASVGLLAGCSTRTPEPTGNPTSSTSTSNINHYVGPLPTDVAPQRLYARPALPVEAGVATSTQALNPTTVIGKEYTPVATRHVESFHHFDASSRGTYKIPVDTTAGASSIFISPYGPLAYTGVEDVVRGNVDILDPNGVKVNARASKLGTDNPRVMSWVPLAGHPAGMYTVSFHGAGPMDTAVEARFDNPDIVLSLRPAALQHLLGGEQYVEATLTEAGKPILGAHLTSELIHGEQIKHLMPVSFTEVGGGVYRAAVHPLFNEGSDTAAYLVDVDADGVAPSGVAFQRHGETGFHFGIPTAQVVDVLAQRQITNSQGLTTAFEVDLKIQSSSLDRLEISGKLTAVGADGVEHPLASAFYGDAFQPGTRVVTLSFDAGNVRMTRLEGDFMVRDLQIYSLGTNTLFSREQAGHNRVFPGIVRDQLVKHEQFSGAQQELVSEGVLFDD